MACANRRSPGGPSSGISGRGDSSPGVVTIADGHLGIWAAFGEQQPTAAERRCGNHRIIKGLDALPKKVQPEATAVLTAMPSAETQRTYKQIRDQFSLRGRLLAQKALERLHRDWERLVTFYQFPQEHWVRDL